MQNVLKVIIFIRKQLHIFDKRVEKENNLVDAINWNEDMLVKLNGSINNLTTFERKNSFHYTIISFNED